MKLDPRRIRITTAPAVEPVTVDEAKLHLRIDHNSEDALIGRLIETARIQCEAINRRSWVTRTYTAQADHWPLDGAIELPLPPALAVTSVGYVDRAGATGTVSAGDYIVDVHREPARIVLKANANWPTAELREINGVNVVWTAGYGAAAAVPAPFKQALLLVLGHLYENREAVLAGSGVHAMVLPMAVDMLLMTDRGAW